ncbi:hypothetical protein [Streptomyces sp. NPDC001089]
MTQPPGPTPPAVIDEETFTGIIGAVTGDSPKLASAVRDRLSESRQGGSVCMMGGWTS